MESVKIDFADSGKKTEIERMIWTEAPGDQALCMWNIMVSFIQPIASSHKITYVIRLK